MDSLIEELLILHASSPTFRLLFESQQITELFIDAYKAMIERLNEVLAKINHGGESQQRNCINTWNIRILEKLNHLGLALALDNAVGGLQKREVLLNFIIYDLDDELFFIRFWIKFIQQRPFSTRTLLQLLSIQD